MIEIEETNNTEKNSKKKMPTYLVAIFFAVCLLICIAAASAMVYFCQLGSPYGKDYETAKKELTEDLFRRYAVIAMADYKGNFNMNMLKYTNLRYGVIHSDQFQNLDLSNMSIYEVNNFDEEFNPDNLFVYSCYRDEYTEIGYDTSLHGYAYLVNKNYDTGNACTAPIKSIVYDYTTNQLYAKVNNYLFPIQCTNPVIIHNAANYIYDDLSSGGTYTEVADYVYEDTSADIIDNANYIHEDNFDNNVTVNQDSNTGITTEEGITYLPYEETVLVGIETASEEPILEAEDTSHYYYISELDEELVTSNSDITRRSNFRSEVNYSETDDVLTWNNPNATLYIPSLNCALRLSDVKIRDYRTLYLSGKIPGIDADISYDEFEDSGQNYMTITYYSPKDFSDITYYVVMYLPENLNTDTADLFVEAYRILDLAYKFLYLPPVLLLIFGLAGIYFLITLVIRMIKKTFYFFRENVPLVLRGSLVFIAVTFVELLLCGFFDYIDFLNHITALSAAILLVLEKFVCYPFIMNALLQLNKLQKGTTKLANGNYEHHISTQNMFFDFKKIGENLNQIQDGMQLAIDEKMKSERFKTELITNVSHDIKTPLTSIVNYVDLLKKENISSEHSEEYLEVLTRQSIKLKKLLEDLIEAAKASTGNLKVNLETCDISVLLSQVIGEYEEKLSSKNIELNVSVPDDNVMIQADPQHMQRILDNLMTNVYKYAQPTTRAYVNLITTEDTATIIMKNISAAQLNITASELMERFVRGDSSRNTDGHGLGLAITESLTQLMGGHLSIDVDGDLFKVTLEFPILKVTDDNS